MNWDLTSKHGDFMGLMFEILLWNGLQLTNYDFCWELYEDCDATRRNDRDWSDLIIKLEVILDRLVASP